MRISILITAYDQNDLSIAHIRGCMGSSRVPDEIIVVNDGGDDKLLSMLTSELLVNKKCSLIYARITEDIRWNQNGARNLGLFLSSGDVVVFEDNDHIPHKDFYGEAEKLIEEGYDRVFVKKRIVVEQDFSKPISEWKQLKTRGDAEIITMVKKEKILAIKGFDEGFCGHYGWDVPDFVERMAKNGEKKIGCGVYYVAPVYSRMNDRAFMGNRPKMEAVNYHLLSRNRRNNVIQPVKPMLNFNYEVKII